MIKKIDRYIIRELIRPTLFGLFIFGSLWLVNLMIRLADLIVAKGVAAEAVFLIFLYTLPTVAVTAAPMASLLGALLAMGRLNADSEIIAAKGCGIGYLRLMVPVFAMGFFISLAAFFFNDQVVPRAMKHQERIMVNEVILKKPVPKMAKDIFFDGGDQFRLYMRRYRPEAKLMEDVTCYQFARTGYPRITEAKQVHMGEDVWTFRDGVTYVYRRDGALTQMVRFEEWAHPFSLDLGKVDGKSKGPKEMNFLELRAYIQQRREKSLPTRHLEVDLWFKTAFPFANLFLILVGTPLACRSVRGKGGGVGLAILLMFVYYVALAVAKALGDGGTISPFLGAWAPNMLMGLLAIWLIRGAGK